MAITKMKKMGVVCSKSHQVNGVIRNVDITPIEVKHKKHRIVTIYGIVIEIDTEAADIPYTLFYPVCRVTKGTYTRFPISMQKRKDLSMNLPRFLSAMDVTRLSELSNKDVHVVLVGNEFGEIIGIGMRTNPNPRNMPVLYASYYDIEERTRLFDHFNKKVDTNISVNEDNLLTKIDNNA